MLGNVVIFFDVFFRPAWAARTISKENLLTPFIVISSLIFLSAYLTTDIIVKDLIERASYPSINFARLAKNLEIWLWSRNIFQFVWIFLLSLAAYFVGSYFRPSFMFRAAFSVIIYAEVIRIAGGCLRALFIYLTRNPNFSLSLAPLAQMAGFRVNSTLYILLDSFGLFFAWEIISLGIMLSIILNYSESRCIKTAFLFFGTLKVFYVMTIKFIMG
jgi:hypothetical protein